MVLGGSSSTTAGRDSREGGDWSVFGVVGSVVLLGVRVAAVRCLRALRVRLAIGECSSIVSFLVFLTVLDRVEDRLGVRFGVRLGVLVAVILNWMRTPHSLFLEFSCREWSWTEIDLWATHNYFFGWPED